MNSAPLHWDDDLLIGHEQTDRQHRALVSSAGELQKALAANAPSEELRRRCATLLERTKENFTSEEGLMLATGYPDYEAHRQEHEQLLKQLTVIHQTVAAENAADLLLTILSAWTIPHIRCADKSLAVFLANSAL